MLMDHLRGGHKDRWPALLPGAKSEIEILNVSRMVDFIESAECEQFASVEERAPAAPIENVTQILARKGEFAAHRKVAWFAVRSEGHYRLAGLLAPQALWKEDLCGSAEKIGDLVERS